MSAYLELSVNLDLSVYLDLLAYLNGFTLSDLTYALHSACRRVNSLLRARCSAAPFSALVRAVKHSSALFGIAVKIYRRVLISQNMVCVVT